MSRINLEEAMLLRERREEAGATREALCEIIGVRANTLYRWETGRVQPCHAMGRAWAAAVERLEAE